MRPLRHRPAARATDGDLKSGSSRCDDSVYLNSLGFLNMLEAPVTYYANCMGLK